MRHGCIEITMRLQGMYYSRYGDDAHRKNQLAGSQGGWN